MQSNPIRIGTARIGYSRSSVRGASNGTLGTRKRHRKALAEESVRLCHPPLPLPLLSFPAPPAGQTKNNHVYQNII